MARKRTINPTIWEDPGFNKLSIMGRLLFIGMFSNADDDGYIRADVGSLKRTIFGFDDDVKQMLSECIALAKQMPSIHFFESSTGEELAHFTKWEIHQKQQKERRQPSILDKCSTCLADAKQMYSNRYHKGSVVSVESVVSVGKEQPIDLETKTAIDRVRKDLVEKMII